MTLKLGAVRIVEVTRKLYLHVSYILLKEDYLLVDLYQNVIKGNIQESRKNQNTM